MITAFRIEQSSPSHVQGQLSDWMRRCDINNNFYGRYFNLLIDGTELERSRPGQHAKPYTTSASRENSSSQS